MNVFGILMLLAVLVQFVVERLKPGIPEKLRSFCVPLLAIIISIVLTLSCQVGLLQALGIGIGSAIVDYVLSGIIISGGSTAFNELIKVLQGIKEGLQSVERK